MVKHGGWIAHQLLSHIIVSTSFPLRPWVPHVLYSHHDPSHCSLNIALGFLSGLETPEPTEHMIKVGLADLDADGNGTVDR